MLIKNQWLSWRACVTPSKLTSREGDCPWQLYKENGSKLEGVATKPTKCRFSSRFRQLAQAIQQEQITTALKELQSSSERAANRTEKSENSHRQELASLKQENAGCVRPLRDLALFQRQGLCSADPRPSEWGSGIEGSSGSACLLDTYWDTRSMASPAPSIDITRLLQEDVRRVDAKATFSIKSTASVKYGDLRVVLKDERTDPRTVLCNPFHWKQWHWCREVKFRSRDCRSYPVWLLECWWRCRFVDG